MEREERQLVAFRMADEVFGVDIEHVKEIITMRPVTSLPKCSEFVEGIINLRGSVIPIYNLRKQCGLPEVEPDRETRIIVVEVSTRVVGMIVDAVSEVIRIKQEWIDQPSCTLASNVDRQFIEGIAKVDSRLILILYLANLLPELNELPAIEQIV